MLTRGCLRATEREIEGGSRKGSISESAGESPLLHRERQSSRMCQLVKHALKNEMVQFSLQALERSQHLRKKGCWGVQNDTSDSSGVKLSTQAIMLSKRQTFLTVRGVIFFF